MSSVGLRYYEFTISHSFMMLFPDCSISVVLFAVQTTNTGAIIANTIKQTYRRETAMYS